MGSQGQGLKWISIRASLAALSRPFLFARALLTQHETATAGPTADNLAARERLEMTRRIIEYTPTGIVILRLMEAGNADSLRIVEMNPAGLRLAGAEGERLADIPLREFSPGVYETQFPEACLSVLKSGASRVLRGELSLRRRPSAYFDLTLFALSDKDICVAFEKVSEQQKAQRIAQENSPLTLLTIGSVRDYAISRLDAVGRVSSWSGGAQLIYGYSTDEIFGSPYSRLLPLEDAAKGLPQEQLDDAARKGRIKTEGWCVRKNGARFWADVELTALHDEAGALLGYVSIARDATQRRLSELSREDMSAALARSNAELTQFASMASHDLREPLHKVNAFAARLKDKLEGKLDDEGRDYLRRMLRAVDGMQNLIDGMLELTRVTTRGCAPAVVDLGALAKDVVESLDLAISRSGASVELGALPRIHADPLLMRQLLQNLISNALRFHRPGARPHVRVQGKTTGDGRCEFAVSDNGIGFDMKHAARIFQPFQRLHNRYEYEGTGMGLAICSKVVARHGGTISAASEPDSGAEFKVNLPISQEGRMECQLLENAFS